MPSEEYEWQQKRAWRPGGGNGTPVNHYELFAIIDPIEKRLELLYEKIDNIEDRLVEERAKHFLADLFVTSTGRITLIVITLIGAYILSKLGYNPFG